MLYLPLFSLIRSSYKGFMQLATLQPNSMIAMLWASQSNALDPPRAMLLDSQSNAFSIPEQCFQTSGAMLWDLRSIVLEVTELCF